MELIAKFLNLLNENAAALTAVATVAIAWLTFTLAKENKRLRKAGTEPEVIASLIPGPDGNGAVNFILANIGQGPALKVKFSLEYDENDFSNHNVLVQNSRDRSAMTVIPQGEKVSVLFGISYVLFGTENPKNDQILKPFKVIITYKDLRGKRRKSVHEIDISQYSGLRGLLSKPASREIADNLKKIEQHLSKISRQVGPILNSVDASTPADALKQKISGSSIQTNDEKNTCN
ncbi:MAG: hypothetical protein CMN55_12790 [Sneathiella sp.]|jgi:hypothetical protein|uniref:hypothetical protein n=1 Tax=Sneathiella sp. TaxID=1964365 RepID=UPI000C47FF9C|nr:hypothetical protein [Sneathiella sp.]MAL79969.1 hypothetical protein [Sneathiella sp.]|tara:strand:+ start:359 stop:1057 length:699 start_codon:yes stop_codon:yes gene_type:complete